LVDTYSDNIEVGILTIQSNLSTGYYVITGFKLEEDYRGQGLATMLMKAMLEDNRWKDRPIIVEPLPYDYDNDEAKTIANLESLYRHYGFSDLKDNNWPTSYLILDRTNKKFANIKLAEISGEWWIIDGNAMFADGDVSELNHEAYVIDHVQRYFGDEEFDKGDYYDWNAFELSVLKEEMGDRGEKNLSQYTIENIINTDYADVVEAGLKNRGMNNTEILIARSKIGLVDVRAYAIKNLGWIRVAKNKCELWKLDAKSIKNLATGLGDVDWEMSDEEVFDIEERSTGRVFQDVPITVIETHQLNKLNYYLARHGAMAL
jgi:hypothetical protein